MKYYAKQIPWDRQDSRIYMDGWDNSAVVLYGNRNYMAETTEEFDRWMENFDSLASCYDDPEEWTVTWKELANDWLHPTNKEKYDEADFKRWEDMLKTCEDLDDEKNICEALEIMTGKEYSHVQICGSCQGDWQTMYYPVDDWSKESLEAFAMLYFNTGSEWDVWDEESGEDESCGYYVTSYNPREWLENELCGEGDELVMYEFTGYSQVGNWTEG